MIYIMVSSLSAYMHPESLAFNNDTELLEETVLEAEAPLRPLSSSHNEEAVLCLSLSELSGVLAFPHPATLVWQGS